nr:MAG TPA: hypothetical protein [Caudoviricetes sp.]
MLNYLALIQLYRTVKTLRGVFIPLSAPRYYI